MNRVSNHGVMNRRVTGLLLALYPRAWRDRYGAEVATLTDELIRAGETTPLPAGLNLFAGAAVERARALAASRTALAVTSAAAIVAMVGGAFVVTGSARPGSGPRAIASGNCLVEPPLQVVFPAEVRLRPTAGTQPTGSLQVQAGPGPKAVLRVQAGPGSKALLQVKARPGPAAPPPVTSWPGPTGLRQAKTRPGLTKEPPQLKGRPGLADRPWLSRRGPTAVMRIAPQRPAWIRARLDKVRQARLELGRAVRVPPSARNCLRTPATAQDPVPGRARKLRARPPVPAATRVTR
jgi:hypothetical protein